MASAERGSLGAALDAALTVLRQRELRRAEASFGAAWTADWAVTVGLGVVAFRDGGAVAVGLVYFARLMPAALLTPISASCGDRSPRVRGLRGGCVIWAAAIATAAGALAADAPLLIVYVAASIATVAFTLFRPAHSALLPSLCASPGELVAAYVVRGLIDSAASLVGPLLAAALLRFTDAAVLFAVVASLSLLAAWLLTDLRYERAAVTGPPERARPLADTVAGIRHIARSADVRRLVLLGSAQTFTRGCLNVLVLVVVVDLLGVADSVTGVLMGVLGGGAVVGSLVLAVVVDGRRLARYVGLGVALWGLPLTAIGLVPEWPVVIVAMAVIGLGNALVDIGIFTLPARLLPNELLSRYFGVFEAVVAVSVAIGSLVTPAVIALTGRRGALIAIGLLGAVVAAACWRGLRAVDRLVSTQDEEIGMLKQIPMFDPLPLPAIEALAGHVGREQVAAGEVVVAEGATGDRFYVISSGTAVVRRQGRVVRELHAGDAFGEIGLLRDVPRTASVIAVTKLDLRTIDRADFLGPMSGYASAARRANDVVARHLAADARADGPPESELA